MPYDHHDKAGNQGDVVKHVALVAALDTLVADSDRACFHYADTFAGYAYNPLDDGASPVDGWKAGIGPLVGLRDRLRENCHVQLWAELCLGDGLKERGYPGSSMIARNVVAPKCPSHRLSLWDTSLRVVEDLRDVIGPESAEIFQRAARWDDEAVRRADFLLIDPPGLRSQHRPDYPRWDALTEFLENRPAHQSILVWLPVKADTTSKPPGEDAASWTAQEEARRYGCQGIRVRWAKGGRTIGCQLIYHLPDAAAKALNLAVKHVVEVAGWQASLPTGVEVVTDRRPMRNHASLRTAKPSIPSPDDPEG